MNLAIGRKQGINILQKFFELDYDFDKVCELLTSAKRSKQQITLFIKAKFRQIILQLQSTLLKMGKIQQLKLYDNSSDDMFDELIQLQNYFPKQLSYDFIFEEKCRYQKIEKSSSSKKMKLYSIFLNYAELKNLFRFVYMENEEKIISKGPFQNLERIYEPSQLQIIRFYYEIYEGDYEKIQSKFKQRGFTDEKFHGQRLYKNLKNLELIGLFRCYLKSVYSQKEKGVSWQQFVEDQEENSQIIEQFEPNLKVILIQIAIRNEAEPFHVKLICKKMDKRFTEKPYIGAVQLPPLKKSQQFCTDPAINNLRHQLMVALKEKIWFNDLQLNR